MMEPQSGGKHGLHADRSKFGFAEGQALGVGILGIMA